MHEGSEKGFKFGSTCHALCATMESLAANLTRAQEAIARARALSTQLQARVTAEASNVQQERESEDDQPSSAPASAAQAQQLQLDSGNAQAPAELQHERSVSPQAPQMEEHQPNEERITSGSLAERGPSSISPMLVVAQKLSLLQMQQNNTMQQLVLLRLEQVWRRKACISGQAASRDMCLP